MPHAVMFISFRLVKGASEADFLLASEKLHREFMSKQKGYISWKQLADGDTWADLLTWETVEDAKNAGEASCANALAHEFFSFLEQESIQTHLFSVKKDYSPGR